MGRLPDRPETQKAKGGPGKRPAAYRRRKEQAERVAELLAAAPAGVGEPMAPPVLHDPMFAPALAIWKELAPELARTHRLPKDSRLIFVQLCVYTAEWFTSLVDVAENGADQRVKTVAGGYMERKRPVYDRRERAFDNVMKLSERFGLTPHDLYALFKDQAMAASQNPGLFDQAGPAAPQPGVQPERPAGMIGSASRLRSEPPSRPH